MNKQIEALKMAIEFIERHVEADEYDWLIKVCKEALAEAENPELVAVQYLYKVDKDNPEMIPLYTHPATWQSLSDDEITKAVLEIPASFPSIFGIARAIEQALKEKNHNSLSS